jgi:hypothetical protein
LAAALQGQVGQVLSSWQVRVAAVPSEQRHGQVVVGSQLVGGQTAGE